MEKSLKYGKYTIEINFGFDERDDNPRNWAQGILYGIDKPLTEFQDEKDEIQRGFWVFPVYKHEHGVVAFSIGTPQAKDFDTGFYGLYAVSRTMGKDDAEELAKAELHEWECYCNGTLYEYHISDEDGEIDEYHSGYFSEDACLADALQDAKYYTERDEKDAVNFWARNND